MYRNTGYYTGHQFDAPNWDWMGEGQHDLQDFDIPARIYATEWPQRPDAPIRGSILAPAWWGSPVALPGHARAKIVTGITYDGTETPIASATVLVFNTSTRALEETAVSDSDGRYVAILPYDSTEYFLRANKDGTPNVAGTTDDNITGA